MSDVTTGRSMIDFATAFMPALADAAAVARSNGALADLRIGIALVLEPKTACLVEAIAATGAEVAVLGSPNSTKPAVVAALRAAGIQVFAEAGASRARMAELRDGFLDTRPQLLADDGAVNARRLHNERRDALDALRGVAEETTSGVRPLRVMHAEGRLEVPCVAVNDARTKSLFDNIHGTGQSVVMAVLDATNMQLQGKVVVVVGYGRVGRGIAATASGLGARVTVTEIDPVAALEAYHDGYSVAPIDTAVTEADFVITASGIGYSLTADHVARMRDGTVIAVGGAGPPEFDPFHSDRPEAQRSIGTWGELVRPHVRELITPADTTVFVISDTYCANTSAGEGNPIEIMDLSLALQLRALDWLARTDLAPGVYDLPREIDDAVALSQLRAGGITIDQPTAAQIDAARRW